jgi:hypothetical protein
VDIDELLQALPTRRIKPVDGLAVTAAVWEEAHDYHRLRQRFHNLLGHGPGILAGLEVIASDPPDTSVYVLPGVAIGAGGEFVVLAEPVAYDIAAAQGPLHVLLSYGEGPPRAGGGPDQGSEILYVHAEFGIEAQLNPAGDSGVELARIRRRDRQAPIADAQDPEHPAPNEIDLRFRREIGAAFAVGPAALHSRPIASMAVCTVGTPQNERHHRGANALGRAMRHAGKTPLWVDDDVPLDPELASYTLVYLVGQGSFELTADEMNGLYTYLQGGGTLFIESCRQDLAAEDPPADAAFFGLLDSLGVHLEAVPPDHPLLTDPYLFAAPPPGFAAEGERKLLAGDGVVFSNYDYGCLWQGERHGGPPTREEIRAALEWGSNVVAYAVRRWRGMNE